MDVDYVIVGGGIAGLCAAVRLTELGATPLVIEGGGYPSHKVCGEFFSPECIKILNHWDIHPKAIHYAHFRTPSSSYKFCFPRPAGSLSHLECDPLLAQRVRRGGAIIKTHTKVEHLDPQSRELTLSTGEVVSEAFDPCDWAPP